MDMHRVIGMAGFFSQIFINGMTSKIIGASSHNHCLHFLTTVHEEAQSVNPIKTYRICNLGVIGSIFG
jgi:hypothetical protein